MNLTTSARLPQFLKLATSKRNRFCETSSMFIVGNIKNKAVLQDFLQKGKIECRADGLVPMRFAIFPLHLSKVLRLARISDARSYEVLHLPRKIILANLKIWCSKMQPLSGNQRPDLLCLLYCACHAKLQIPHACHRFWNCHKTLRFFSLSTRCTIPCACRAKRNLNVQKCSETVIFYSFDLEMCFAPQRRALFRHVNFHGVLCTFWLPNVLRATTACNCSSLIWPGGSAPAALASLLFDPPKPQIIGKTQCFATFLPFRASASSFF